MSSLPEAIRALRDAVAGSAGETVDVDAAVDPTVFGPAEVTMVPGMAAIDHLATRPVGALDVAQLEAILGVSRKLPRRPSGGATRTVLFEDTIPDPGKSGTTVLAEVDDAGRVQRLVVRADAL